jgi:hypothetical protein
VVGFEILCGWQVTGVHAFRCGQEGIGDFVLAVWECLLFSDVQVRMGMGAAYAYA